MGSVSGLRGQIAEALHHKDERYRSFVYHKGLDGEYLKLWTHSNAVMDDKRRLLPVRPAHELIRHTWPCDIWVRKVDMDRVRTAAPRGSLAET